MDWRPPGSSVHGIIQARILEWVVISFSKTAAESMKLSFNHVWLSVTLRTVAPPGSSVHGILQERILEWAVIPFSRGSCRPRDQTCLSFVFCIGKKIIYQLCHLESPIITWSMFKYHNDLITNKQISVLLCKSAFWVSLLSYSFRLQWKILSASRIYPPPLDSIQL